MNGTGGTAQAGWRPLDRARNGPVELAYDRFADAPAGRRGDRCCSSSGLGVSRAWWPDRLAHSFTAPRVRRGPVRPARRRRVDPPPADRDPRSPAALLRQRRGVHGRGRGGRRGRRTRRTRLGVGPSPRPVPRRRHRPAGRAAPSRPRPHPHLRLRGARRRGRLRLAPLHPARHPRPARPACRSRTPPRGTPTRVSPSRGSWPRRATRSTRRPPASGSPRSRTGVWSTAASQSRQIGAQWHGPAIESVSVPTLVVHGAADPLIRPSAARAIARRVPGARLRLLPGVGHDLPGAGLGRGGGRGRPRTPDSRPRGEGGGAGVRGARCGARRAPGGRYEAGGAKREVRGGRRTLHLCMHPSLLRWESCTVPRARPGPRRPTPPTRSPKNSSSPAGSPGGSLISEGEIAERASLSRHAGT